MKLDVRNFMTSIRFSTVVMRSLSTIFLLSAGLLCGCRYFIGGPFERNLPAETVTVSLQEIPDQVLAAYLRSHTGASLVRTEAVKHYQKVLTFRFSFREMDGTIGVATFDPKGRPQAAPNGSRQ